MYLVGSEIAFRRGGHLVFQMQLAKTVDAVPLTRDYMLDWEREHRHRRRTRRLTTPAFHRLCILLREVGPARLGGSLGVMETTTASRVTPLRDTDLALIRTPPSNTDAEQALLGAILINNAPMPGSPNFCCPSISATPSTAAFTPRSAS